MGSIFSGFRKGRLRRPKRFYGAFRGFSHITGNRHGVKQRTKTP